LVVGFQEQAMDASPEPLAAFFREHRRIEPVVTETKTRNRAAAAAPLDATPVDAVIELWCYSNCSSPVRRTGSTTRLTRC
jgi:hypothetical protein